jgi:hypothetical protein
VIIGVIFFACVAKLFAGNRWDDWLDERWGRGSIRDWWALNHRDRNGR